MGPAHAVYPPIERLALQHVPFVDRIAPTLSGRTEIIWGHPGDAYRSKVSIKFKDFRVGPNVGTVIVHKNRYVANEANISLRAVGAQGSPLLIEGKLDRLLNLEIIPAFLCEFDQ